MCFGRINKERDIAPDPKHFCEPTHRLQLVIHVGDPVHTDVDDEGTISFAIDSVKSMYDVHRL